MVARVTEPELKIDAVGREFYKYTNLCPLQFILLKGLRNTFAKKLHIKMFQRHLTILSPGGHFMGMLAKLILFHNTTHSN